MLSTDREGALPDIQILYLGQIYDYSLPWHNAWVLIAITVPVSILAAAIVGLVFALRDVRRDRLPLYFLVHLVTLPVAADARRPPRTTASACSCPPSSSWPPSRAGGRSGSPTGWRDGSGRRRPWSRALVAALVLAPAAWQLVKVHPFELSYYNELIGGPSGAWKAGFELSYWYDAFNGRAIAELNERLPPGAAVEFLNDLDQPADLPGAAVARAPAGRPRVRGRRTRIGSRSSGC